ncbi:hypothetical protein PG994_000846 [Apiospora phragmitis]|uniref:Uncharacterized protein n=1 Tax=Apiospora phragmitis TaxID=2905665 RepID=A0ABR1X793_9PEZI
MCFLNIDAGLSDADVEDPIGGFALTLTWERAIQIYHCVGGGNTAWDHILDWLRTSVHEDLKYYNREDLLPSHDLHMIDEPALYGATHRPVREHFRSWGFNDLRRKLRPGVVDPHMKYMTSGYYSPVHHRPRYQYCLVVDDLCLESLALAEAEYDLFSPAVKLLMLDWLGPTVEEEGVDGEQGPESHPTDDEAEWWFE